MARLRLLNTFAIISGSYCIVSALAGGWYYPESYSLGSCLRVEYPQDRLLERFAKQSKLCDGVKSCSALRLRVWRRC